jgi:hypothetical protein
MVAEDIGRRDGTFEIELGGGSRCVFDGMVDEEALKQVLRAAILHGLPDFPERIAFGVSCTSRPTPSKLRCMLVGPLGPAC